MYRFYIKSLLVTKQTVVHFKNEWLDPSCSVEPNAPMIHLSNIINKLSKHCILSVWFLISSSGNKSLVFHLHNFVVTDLVPRQ